MNGLHENQTKILNFLLDHHEGATLDEIAEHLELTKTGAKEHLIKVETLGYLSFKDSKGMIGRPRRRYFLSQEGHNVFPKQYSWLSNVLLELLAVNFGKTKVAQLMKNLADKVAKSMEPEFKNVKSSVGLLGKVLKMLNELGYRAVLKQSDLRKGAIIEASNCVYHAVAKEHPDLCGFDVRLIQNTSGMNVKLETCIAHGGPVCKFRLTKAEVVHQK